ncbi:helix-turn-helix domain-containing protein [Gallibacterium anatis]|uniref:helix-turn-helix domain-containing protein n=1 Tax=Gallibacterium anatis TaxID=750 RepID=UPI0039FCAC7A
MLTRRKLNSLEIMDRMKKISNVSSDKGLAEILGIAPQSITKWKNNDLVPFEQILKIANTYDISIDWLIYGKNASNELSTHEKMALLAFNDLNERQKLNAIAYMTGLHQEGGKQPAIVQTANGD